MLILKGQNRSRKVCMSRRLLHMIINNCPSAKKIFAGAECVEDEGRICMM